MKNSLQLDVKGTHARALHRVIRAMHDGHCPDCGHLGPSSDFRPEDYASEYKCPSCGFGFTYEETKAALAQFHPHLKESVQIFKSWRDKYRETGDPAIKEPEKLGEIMKRLRERAGLSLRQLHELSGMHYTNLSAIESGRRKLTDHNKIRSFANIVKASQQELEDMIAASEI